MLMMRDIATQMRCWLVVVDAELRSTLVLVCRWLTDAMQEERSTLWLLGSSEWISRIRCSPFMKRECEERWRQHYQHDHLFCERWSCLRCCDVMANCACRC
jgi:hypothetical protein